jgi:hypothetical protein
VPGREELLPMRQDVSMRARIAAVALASILLLTGCSTAATSAAPETQQATPSASPQQQAAPKQVPTSQPTIAPQDASFEQLWASSGFNETNPASGFSVKGDDPATIAKGLDDLAPAVEKRCYPALDADQVGELSTLRAAFDAAAADPAVTSDALYAAGKAYFDQAITLCM